MCVCNGEYLSIPNNLSGHNKLERLWENRLR